MKVIPGWDESHPRMKSLMLTGPKMIIILYSFMRRTFHVNRGKCLESIWSRTGLRWFHSHRLRAVSHFSLVRAHRLSHCWQLRKLKSALFFFHVFIPSTWYQGNMSVYYKALVKKFVLLAIFPDTLYEFEEQFWNKFKRRIIYKPQCHDIIVSK